MLVDALLRLPRWTKRTLLAGSDFFLLTCALWVAFCLRLGIIYVPAHWHDVIILAAAPVLGVSSLFHMRVYKFVTRQITQQNLNTITIALLLSVAAWAVAIVLSDSRTTIPRSTIIIYCVLSIMLIGGARTFVAAWLNRALRKHAPGLDNNQDASPVLIYGVGQTALNLIEAIQTDPNYRVEALLDDDPSIRGQRIHGIKVYSPEYLEQTAASKGITTLFVAKPEATKAEKMRLLKNRTNPSIDIRVLPTLSAIVAGKVDINHFQSIAIEDLLGRSPVAPDETLLGKAITGKSVMVTGAGGSIGSELCRQIIEQKPERLVLFEQSELALYEIEQELNGLLKGLQQGENKQSGRRLEPQIIMVLGSVTDDSLVRDTIRQYRVKTIYHAAAYKHVPIVEFNPVVGLHNNTWGTITVADAAADLGVERFILVSTDKAVRPTNVMGTSKRMSELYLQGMASRDDLTTVFTMVRFGNVLDSSGSVVGKFRQQIKDGGPITVTHPDITRYFMSIPEAAELVIQAGSMASGGEVFMLDMGDPVKIVDLAKSMIRLSGMTQKTDDNPDGDIAISFVGLRPGEKLFEELLISGSTAGTIHPKIMKTEEDFLPIDVMREKLDELRNVMEAGDQEALIEELTTIVSDYKPQRDRGKQPQSPSSEPTVPVDVQPGSELVH